MKSEVFPVALKLKGRPCVVVGQGEEAERRAVALLSAGATVHVVSAAPSDAVVDLARSAALVLSQREFETRDLDQAWLVVVTDMDIELAARVHRDAEASRIFCCAVDQPQFCSFSHMALARADALTVAISTEGKAPSLARRLREEFERLFAEAKLADFVRHLAALRERVPSADRKTVLGEAVSSLRFEGALKLPSVVREGAAGDGEPK